MGTAREHAARGRNLDAASSVIILRA